MGTTDCSFENVVFSAILIELQICLASQNFHPSSGRRLVRNLCKFENIIEEALLPTNRIERSQQSSEWWENWIENLLFHCPTTTFRIVHRSFFFCGSFWTAAHLENCNHLNQSLLGFCHFSSARSSWWTSASGNYEKRKNSHTRKHFSLAANFYFDHSTLQYIIIVTSCQQMFHHLQSCDSCEFWTSSIEVAAWKKKTHAEELEQISF